MHEIYNFVGPKILFIVTIEGVYYTHDVYYTLTGVYG